MAEGPIFQVLFVGDVVGKGGRLAVKKLVPELKKEFNCSFCIVNAENCANGAGMTKACLDEMGTDVDVFTSGDHTWDQKQFEQEITTIPNVLRPANYSYLQPGRGWKVFRNSAGMEIAVIVLLGKVFMKESAHCPFETAEEVLKQIPATCKAIFVDIHAEATSEKAAMAWMLDGKVTAVIGTHTHVQTADARILPNGTALLSDAGMVGVDDSILGRDVNSVVRKFRTGMPSRMPVPDGTVRFCGAVVSYEMKTGRAVAIQPVSRLIEVKE